MIVGLVPVLCTQQHTRSLAGPQLASVPEVNPFEELGDIVEPLLWDKAEGQGWAYIFLMALCCVAVAASLFFFFRVYDMTKAGRIKDERPILRSVKTVGGVGAGIAFALLGIGVLGAAIGEHDDCPNRIEMLRPGGGKLDMSGMMEWNTLHDDLVRQAHRSGSV